MKALNKGKAKEFFKKKQQKKQDINQIINQVQAKSIATQVGIAQQEIPSFKWFFDQLEKFKLPSYYEKQLNQKRTQLIYLNKNTNESSKEHPLLSMIRTFFYTEYKSTRSAFTFSNKQQKLLPYVEDRMMKNCISLNSKRRQVQKVNLQKDQNGKIVLSKMARIRPDTKNLVSARSYMLKMLIQKVYTTKQIWGKGKRAKAFANVLNEKYKDMDQGGDIFESIDPQDLQTYQTIFTEAAEFYQEEFGDILKIPDLLKQSQSYKNSTPQSVMRYLFLLNISKNQIEFYWFGRLMDCLPIPHNWSINLSSNTQTYFYQPLKLKFDIHPSYIYMVLQMNKFKDYFSTLKDQQKTIFYEDRKMTFIDFFQRQYTVDIYGLLVEHQLKNLQQNTDNPLLKQDNTRLKQNNANDWMIVQAIINTDIKPQEYPLIGTFCDFWASKNFYDQQWIPTVSPFGQITWSDSVNYSSIDYCPYKQVLNSKLQLQRQKLLAFNLKDFKQNIKQEIQIIDGKIKVKQNTKTSIQLIQVSQQRQKFIEHYIKNIDSPNPISYDIKGNDLRYYFDQIFLCPFDMDVKQMNESRDYFQLQQEEDQIPLWKQKVLARKFSAKIKNAIRQNYDFEQLKQLVRQFTQETTSKKEPQKMQQMKQKLRNIRNLKQLEQFVQNVTDIDAREQRKRQELQKMKQKRDEDDIFGSQEEDFNIEEANISGQKRSVEESQQEVESQAQSEKFQQPQQDQQEEEQFSSSSQSQPQMQPQRVPTIHQQEDNQQIHQKQRSQYSFIKQMKQQQKQYKKCQTLQKADDLKIENMIKKQIKRKNNTLKYTNSHFKNNINYQKKLFQNLKNQQHTKNIKKNLIETNFKYSTVPYKDERTFKFQNNQTASQYLNKKSLQKLKKIQQIKNYSTFQPIDNSRFINGFLSEIDQEYDATQTIQYIQQLPKKQIVQEDIQIPYEDEAQYEIKITPKKEDEIIVLQPIKRIKPDIQQDPRLRHVQSLDPQFQFNMLNTIFMKKTNIKQAQSPNKLRIRSRSTSNLIKALESTQNSSEKSVSLLKNSPTKKKQISAFQSLKSLKKDKILEQKIFPSISSSYNRVCLGHTASTLLVSEPIKRKSQLLVLQARKNLLHKGRGLETYLSRKY